MDDLILTPGQYERMLDGAIITLRILGSAFLLGITLSLVVGVARLSTNRLVRGAALVFVEFARGISSIILLFIMAYAIPILLDIEQRSLILLGSIALGINMGGYGAEIIRGAILSVPKGQTEASLALNLTEMQRLRFVVLPQALRVILPPMGNLTIEILKGTALVYLIGVTDLLDAAQRLRRLVPSPVVFLNALIMYFVLAQIISALFRLAESRVEARYRSRTGAPDTAPASDIVGAKG